eukprot:ANDGO_00302.mRNA.1 Mitogen-activated protein kinase kinase kinase A
MKHSVSRVPELDGSRENPSAASSAISPKVKLVNSNHRAAAAAAAGGGGGGGGGGLNPAIRPLDFDMMKRNESMKNEIQDLEKQLIEERARFREGIERIDRENTLLRQKYNRKHQALQNVEKSIAAILSEARDGAEINPLKRVIGRMEELLRITKEDGACTETSEDGERDCLSMSENDVEECTTFSNTHADSDAHAHGGDSDSDNGLPDAVRHAHARESRHVVRWKKGEVIGSGAYGTVYLGLNLDTGELLAVKSMEVSDGENHQKIKTEIETIQKEIQLLEKLKHMNIVRYVGTEFRERQFNVLLEYVPGGSIGKLVTKFGSLNEKVARMYVQQVLQGLDYLHDNRIVHRDIKGANILVDHSGHVKLADFGCSKNIQDIVTPRGARGEESIMGTPFWMAPEVVMGHGHRRESDIWSVGCVIIEMATGSPPFSEFSPPLTALYHIGTSEHPPPFPNDFSPEGIDFLKLCFQRDPKQRPGARFLLEHPWLQAHSTIPRAVRPKTLKDVHDAASARTGLTMPGTSSQSSVPATTRKTIGALLSSPSVETAPSWKMTSDFDVPHFAGLTTGTGGAKNANSHSDVTADSISDSTRSIALQLLVAILPHRRPAYKR